MTAKTLIHLIASAIEAKLSWIDSGYLVAAASLLFPILLTALLWLTVGPQGTPAK